MKRSRLLPLFVALALAASVPLHAATPIPGLPEPLPPPALDDPGVQSLPADAFFAAFDAHCGKAYAGRVLVDTPASADNPFADRRIVMHVHECGTDTIRVALHVGDDHSRTWVISRNGSGLRLKHDHRHEDGSPDAVTMYGGDTVAPGTPTRQEFPVDAESVAMFTREGLAASVTNTWAIEIEPGKRYLYELSRPGGRLFQVEFDLTAPQPLPPPAWGAIPR